MSDKMSQLMHLRKRDPRFLTWYRLLRVMKKAVGYISPTFLESGLTRPQFDLLGAIAMDEGQTQQTYAERMTVTKGNITQQLDRLEKNGLVLRCKEGRTNCLHLTEKGWEVMSHITPAHDEHLYQMFEALSPEEIKQLGNILRKLEQRIE